MTGPDIGWSREALAHPALESVRGYAARLAALDRFPSVVELDAMLRDRLAIEPAVALETQHKKRRRRAPLDRDALYVIRIHDARRVPTRERSWHDLLNALVWAAFPRSKRALTARQRAITELRVPPGARAIPGARSREEDALAMVDEGGIVLVTGSSGVAALAAAHREGDGAAIRTAIAAGDAIAHVFGHALMEHAVAGDPSVRGYGIVLGCDALDVEAADGALARWIGQSDALLEPAPWRGLALADVLP